MRKYLFMPFFFTPLFSYAATQIYIPSTSTFNPYVINIASGTIRNFNISTVTLNGHFIQAEASTFTYTIQNTRAPANFSMSQGPSQPSVLTNISIQNSAAVFDNFDRSNRMLSSDLTPTGTQWVLSGLGQNLATITNGVYVSTANTYASLDYGSNMPKISGAFSFLPSTNPANNDQTTTTLALIMDSQQIGLNSMLHINFGLRLWGLNLYVNGVPTLVSQGSMNLAMDGTLYGFSMEVNGSSVTVRPPQGPAVTYSSATIASTTYRYGIWQITAAPNAPTGRWHGVSMGRVLSETNRSLGGGLPANDPGYPILNPIFINASSATIGAISISSLTATGIASFGVNGVSIKGTTTNDNASAGFYGEYASTSATVSTNFATSGSYSDLVSTQVAAGDWDFSAGIWITLGGAVSIQGADIGISQSPGNSTTGLVLGDNRFTVAGSTTSDFSAWVPSYRQSLSAPTTIYLKIESGYTGSAPRARGRLSGRRVR